MTKEEKVAQLVMLWAAIRACPKDSPAYPHLVIALELECKRLELDFAELTKHLDDTLGGLVAP